MNFINSWFSLFEDSIFVNILSWWLKFTCKTQICSSGVFIVTHRFLHIENSEEEGLVDAQLPHWGKQHNPLPFVPALLLQRRTPFIVYCMPWCMGLCAFLMITQFKMVLKCGVEVLLRGFECKSVLCGEKICLLDWPAFRYQLILCC